MKIGVLALQGAVPEHRAAVERALSAAGRTGEALLVRRLDDLSRADALVIPGGESTTISRLIDSCMLRAPIIERVEEGMPVMGTCAGCILLAKEGDAPKARLLGLMEMRVRRNAFGRQRESFELPLHVEGWENPFNAVFIRAPIIEKLWGRCRALASVPEGAVMAAQGHRLAVAFHPELTQDTRAHEILIGMV
ncbi:MAG: pyridoxal 5'-phosphate synthase glutaminase subunit PdxT [Candidatus Thermoplasmatota archaeon]